MPRLCLACLGDQVTSVHFNSGEPDFGSLPRRAILIGEDSVRAGKQMGDSDCTFGRLEAKDACIAMQELAPERSESLESVKAIRDKIERKTAAALLARGEWRDALAAYERLAARDGWTGDLRDRVETLTEALEAPPSSQSSARIRRYFAALDRVYNTDGQREVAAMAEFAAIAKDKEASFLRPHARYQIAALYSEWLDYPHAIPAYQSLLRDFPHCSKREAALIMIARAAILPTTSEGRNAPAGEAAIHALLAISPASRFRRAALGLQARLDYFSHKYPAAVAEYLALDDMASAEIVLAQMPRKARQTYYAPLLAGYLRRLNSADNYDDYAIAVRSVRQAMAQLSPADARRFVAMLRRDPDLAAPYFYYRLYLCDNSLKDLSHLARLGARLAAGRGNGQNLALSPLVQVRLAEVYYQDRQYEKALQWATPVGSHSTHPTTSHDRALYVEGASLHKMGRDSLSIRAFERLLRDCPNSPLRVATREELALVREAIRDLSGALDEYFFLNYRPDIAFFLDVRMTTAEVARFVAAHPNHRERELLIYSLGIRYLRDENWLAARRCLERLPRARYVRLGESPDDNGYRPWDSSDGPDPLKAIGALSKLEKATQIARSPTARASALFQYASFYYKSPLLLLYNGALWQDGREVNFDFWWNEDHATNDDRRDTLRHMRSHETYARAERICLQIARDYPGSPTTPYALYRAACCEDKLANFNGWWRSDESENHRLAAAKLMAKLVRRFPRHALAPEARKFARVWLRESKNNG